MPAAFHERLEQLAQAKGVSPSKLGLDAGLSSDTVNKWKRLSKKGSVSGRSEEHAKLAKYWGVSVAWMLGDSDSGGPNEIGHIGRARGAPTEEMREAAYVALVKEDVRPRWAAAAVAAAAAYVQTLERLPTTVDRMVELADGILRVDPDAKIPGARPPKRPVGATHTLRGVPPSK